MCQCVMYHTGWVWSIGSIYWAFSQSNCLITVRNSERERERASYLGRGGGGGGTRGAGRGGRGRLDFCLLAVLMLDSLGLGGSLGVPLVLGGREGGQGGPGGPVVGLCRPEQQILTMRGKRLDVSVLQDHLSDNYEAVRMLHTCSRPPTVSSLSISFFIIHHGQSGRGGAI